MNRKSLRNMRLKTSPTVDPVTVRAKSKSVRALEVQDKAYADLEVVLGAGVQTG